jgi:tetratricopeptide (TPR) repeat protein
MDQWTGQEVFLISDRAYSLATQGRYHEAMILFEGLIEVAPDNRYCVHALAACHVAVGDPRGALRVLDRGLARWPNDQEMRERRCEALLDVQEWEFARLEYARLQGAADSPRLRRLRMRFASMA